MVTSIDDFWRVSRTKSLDPSVSCLLDSIFGFAAIAVAVAARNRSNGLAKTFNVCCLCFHKITLPYKPHLIIKFFVSIHLSI